MTSQTLFLSSDTQVLKKNYMLAEFQKDKSNELIAHDQDRFCLSYQNVFYSTMS